MEPTSIYALIAFVIAEVSALGALYIRFSRTRRDTRTNGEQVHSQGIEVQALVLKFLEGEKRIKKMQDKLDTVTLRALQCEERERLRQ